MISLNQVQVEWIYETVEVIKPLIVFCYDIIVAIAVSVAVRINL